MPLISQAAASSGLPRLHDKPPLFSAVEVSGFKYTAVGQNTAPLSATWVSGVCGGLASPCSGAETTRRLTVAHVGSSLVRAGIETWLKAVVKYSEQLSFSRCIATTPEFVDPELAGELGIPLVVGGREQVCDAARDCDVLLAWGPEELGDWLEECRPRLCLVMAHSESPTTRRILERCAPVADLFVAVSGRVRDTVCAGLPSVTIPNGIDVAAIAPSRSREECRERLGFAANDFVLGFVGRFSPEKRPELVIDAVHGLPPQFKALMVGWGPLRGDLLEHANDCLPGRCVFRVARGDVGDYYHAMDALCLPSREEGFGLVVLEAMFRECPVIATAVGCVPDLIEDRVSGLVVDGTAESIAAAANMLQSRPAWARGLVAHARTVADRHGHARAMVRQYEELILGLWNRKFHDAPV